MNKFRKKPVVIEALQWNVKNLNEMQKFVHGHDVLFYADILSIRTLEGTLVAVSGDWIIKGIKGELYPCKDDIFRETYDPVEED